LPEAVEPPIAGLANLGRERVKQFGASRAKQISAVPTFSVVGPVESAVAGIAARPVFEENERAEKPLAASATNIICLQVVLAKGIVQSTMRALKGDALYVAKPPQSLPDSLRHCRPFP
jgi:hypothetical protein